MNQPPTRDAATFPSAELDRRFYAFVLDRIIAWGLFAGAGYVAWRLLLDQGQVLAGIAAIVGAVLVVSLAYALVLGLAGLTPGKALVGLRVVRQEDGRPIGIWAALVRTTVLGVAALPTFGLGAATLAWTAVMDPSGRRRGWHDQLARAAVVDVRPAPEVGDDVEERPRQVVNLTAMRLMPAPAPAEIAAPVRAPRPTSPPVVAARVAAPALAAPAFAAPAAAPVEPPSAPPPPAYAPRRSASPVPVPAPAPAPPAPAPPAPLPPAPLAQTEAGATWRVSFDTGESFVVEGLALVGRRPEAREGEPVRHLVPLRSTDMSVSKTHAQFQVVPDGALVVMDRGSTNGSVVIRQGVSKPLTAGRPATLVDGDTVRFGDRRMTVAKEQS